MTHYPAAILALIKNFARLPGVGEKTAERLALHLLRAPRGEALALARSIEEIKDRIGLCRRCGALSDGELCRICSNPARDSRQICVVEQQADMVSIEKSGAFNGVYHILQGVLSPIDGIGPGEIRIDELVARVGGGHVEEVILATSISIEGEATADYIAQRLAPCAVKVTRIASGVPVGGDLKYVDQVTLKRAMEGRHSV
ncbi:MAG: recombination mediator RecR [Desulfobacterales bacterium]|nr:recombination mediator RecR [Desulfobacterales bacterium]